MDTQVTPEQVARYRDDGFVVLDRLLDDAELAEWRAAFDEAVAERAGSRVPHRPDRPEAVAAMTPEQRAGYEYYDKVFTQKLFLWRSSERMGRLVLDPGLARLAADLEGVDAVRVWQDQALVKEPWGHPTAFHIDGPIFAFDTPHCVSIWVALDDATLSNGCLGYLPGTHKVRSMRNAAIGSDLGGLFEANPEWSGIEPRYCPIPAGSAVAHNGFIAHGAGANMTPGRRRAMTVVYMADGATFDRADGSAWDGAWAWSREERARYRPGDRLDHDEQFPLAFARAAGAAAP
jgi:ectoine hydroxylase-related dioxygenase (phytanoyl-CoA dioxygenase family)